MFQRACMQPAPMVAGRVAAEPERRAPFASGEPACVQIRLLASPGSSAAWSAGAWLQRCEQFARTCRAWSKML
jgi:hypothetical protein